MSRKYLMQTSILSCFLIGAAAAYGQSRVAVINIQEAIQRTQEGQKLGQELQNKYKPTQDKLQQKQSEIASLREQLNKGANTMSDDAKRKILREIQVKERGLQRDSEDAQADFNLELQQFQQQVGSKLMTVIDKYAKEKGFSVVLDISSSQSPVLYATNEVHITKDIIDLYDKEYPAQAASSSSPAAATSPAAKPTP